MRFNGLYGGERQQRQDWYLEVDENAEKNRVDFYAVNDAGGRLSRLFSIDIHRGIIDRADSVDKRLGFKLTEHGNIQIT